MLPESGVPAEVLIRIDAAAVNNTDINTRIGWYSRSVTGQTGDGALTGCDRADSQDASWSGKPMGFPRIQGADCCGEIVAMGDQVSAERIGQQVLVRPMHPETLDAQPYRFVTFGSECDGCFAQFARVRADQAFSTAENMLARAAQVIAICGDDKRQVLQQLGADLVLGRSSDLLAELRATLWM